MQHHIRHYFRITLLVLSAFACGTNDSWKTEFNALQKEIAPDRRVAIFEYDELENNQIVFKTNLEAGKGVLEKLIQKKELNASIEYLPSDDFSIQSFGIVSLSVANMRGKPAESAELTTQAIMGTVLKLYERKRGWIRVQTPDMYIGWMDNLSIYKVDETEVNEWINSDKVVFFDNYGLMLETPNENAASVTDLTAGNLLRKISESRNYVKVATPDGREGFLPKKSIKSIAEWKNTPNPTAQDLLTTAKRLKGVPYLWGGTSFKGVDCSGFTKMTFLMHGIQLPRDASQQVHVGEAVEVDTTFANAQPGDLLFFGSKATDTKAERVVHVGIYMGDGFMIHSSGRVRIESLKRGEPTFNEYRLKSFLRAKRMLTKIDSDGIPHIKNLNLY